MMSVWVRYTAVIVILFVVHSCVCTEISHPNITGTVACIDRVEFYADGVRYIHNNDGIWNAVSPINIPGNTQLIAINCTKVNDWYGISALLSNGIRTDTSWKCSDEQEDNWNTVEFNDTAWKNAKLLPFWIWTTSGVFGTGVIYCRKSITSTISDQQITGNAYCYDEMEFYADGVQYTHPYDNVRYNPSPINIPGSTQLVAIRCNNTVGVHGINVGLSNGDRTDTTWKCSDGDEGEEGWNTVDFDDSAWNNAKLMRVSNGDWIWTSENVQHVYCRKSILVGTTTSTTSVVGLSTTTTAVVELSTTTTTVVDLNTATIALGESCSPATISEQPCSPTTTVVELSSATTTVVEQCSPTTTVVEPCSPTTTVLEPCSPTPTVVELSTTTTTVVEHCSPTITVVEPCSPTITVVEPCSPTTTVLEPCSPTTTVVEPCSQTTTLVTLCTQIADFDLQPSSTVVSVLGSDGVLRSQVCQGVVVVTSESAMKEEAVTSIYKELTVDKSKISSVIRKKVSQKDERSSSTAIGYFGLIFALLPLALIIMSDIPKLVEHLRKLIRVRHT